MHNLADGLPILPTAAPGPSRRGGTALQVALIGGGAAMAVAALVMGMRFAAVGRTADFGCFLFGAHAAANGSDLQAPGGGYIYPPLLAVLLRPLTWMSPASAAMVWNGLMWALLAISSVMASRLALSQVGRPPRWRETLTVAGAAWLILGDKLILELRDGNCDAIIMTCWVLGLAALRRQPWLVGLAIGLALNIKYTAGVLVVYLLLRRCWAEVAWSSVWTLSFAALPALAMGWHAAVRAWAGALGGVGRLLGLGGGAGPAAEIHSVTWELSVSVTSAMARLAEALGLNARMGELSALALGLVAAAWVTCWRARRGCAPFWRRRLEMGGLRLWPHGNPDAAAPDEPARTSLEWWGLMAGLLVFSPQTPIRHMNMALPLVCLVAAALYVLVPRRQGLLLTISLAIFAGSLWLPPGGAWSHGLLRTWRNAAVPSLGLAAVALAATWGLWRLQSSAADVVMRSRAAGRFRGQGCLVSERESGTPSTVAP